MFCCMCRGGPARDPGQAIWCAHVSTVVKSLCRSGSNDLHAGARITERASSLQTPVTSSVSLKRMVYLR
jgi:hypothetical protein